MKIKINLQSVEQTNLLHHRERPRRTEEEATLDKEDKSYLFGALGGWRCHVVDSNNNFQLK